MSTRQASQSERARRPVRSYVRREGRMTPAQRRALEQLGARYLVSAPEGASRLSPPALFGRSAPLSIEIGFGNGDNLLARCQAEPERDFLGIEVHRPGVGRLLDRADEAGITNLRVACHDAVEVLRDWLPPACADEVQILFPDPWPKKRHHKRRLIQPPFVDLLAAVLAPGGRLWLATDWADYAEQMLAVLGADPRFANLSAEGGTIPRPPNRPVTRFEARGRRLGHAVFDFGFRRVEDGG